MPSEVTAFHARSSTGTPNLRLLRVKNRFGAWWLDVGFEETSQGTTQTDDRDWYACGIRACTAAATAWLVRMSVVCHGNHEFLKFLEAQWQKNSHQCRLLLEEAFEDRAQNGVPFAHRPAGRP